MRYLWLTLLFLVLGLAGWVAYLLRPQALVLAPTARTPVCELTGGRTVVTLPHARLAAEVGRFQDEIFAYLIFDHLRGAKALGRAEVLLTYQKTGSGIAYPIVLHLENNLLAAIPYLARLQSQGLIAGFEWRYIPEETLARQRQQTQTFVTAYNLPRRHRLERLTPPERTAYVRRFVRFKSSTDLRVRKSLADGPRALSREEAHRLAADIIAVADFYSLPVDFFLGIGAMENNYLNVHGDIGHTVWKRHAQKGDIILKRRSGRVMIVNESSGVWQITRETLRYAHALYLKDKRDYCLLPERLRPPRELNLDEINPEILTTYAGILLRDLLDRFHGDVAQAVGAYNGGPRKPNPEYAAGVTMVAGYARRILEHAAALHGRPASETPFLAPARSPLAP